jgi:hypothetical protein
MWTCTSRTSLSASRRRVSPNTRAPSLLGYARVSTGQQELALQRDALAAAGCPRIFSDTASGALDERPELTRVLDHLREGDTLVVWRLDRLGRSLRHLVDTISGLAERGVGFRSLQESIDTTTPGGRLVFHVFAALAEFEGDLIRERTRAGLAAARARGRRGGRPSVMTADNPADFGKPVTPAARTGDTPADLPTALGGLMVARGFAQPLAPAAKGGDTPADFPGASRAPQYEAPRTISIVRPERTVVRNVDQVLPIALSSAALLLALAGVGIGLARTGVARRGLAGRTH